MFFFSFFLIPKWHFFYPIKYIHIYHGAKIIVHSPLWKSSNMPNRKIGQKWRKNKPSLQKTQLKIKPDIWQIYLSIYEDWNNLKLCLLLWWWMSAWFSWCTWCRIRYGVCLHYCCAYYATLSSHQIFPIEGMMMQEATRTIRRKIWNFVLAIVYHTSST